MCKTPINIVRKNRKFGDNQNSVVDTVPCGKCPICINRKAYQWCFRLSKEMERSHNASFWTFTYEEAPLSQNGLPTLKKRDFQNFIKKLRHKAPNLKYYACGEYGSKTYRPHYHAILFNLPLYLSNKPYEMEGIWQHGFTHVGTVTQASLLYVTKYQLKKQDFNKDIINTITGEILKDDREKEKSFMSKKLGDNYLTPNMVNYHVSHMLGAIPLAEGKFTSMPRYYKDKIFSKSEKKQIAQEFLAMHELDLLNLSDDLITKHFRDEHESIKAMFRRQEKLNSLKIQKL